MTIVAGSDNEKSDAKALACAVCRRWFTPRRSTARFCGPRCRQRAHRRPTLAPVDGLKNAKDNAGSNRSPCGSATGLPAPPPETAARQPALVLDGLSTTLHMVPDQHWPNMWRIAFPNGRFSICSISRGPRTPSGARHVAADVLRLVLTLLCRRQGDEIGAAPRGACSGRRCHANAANGSSH